MVAHYVGIVMLTMMKIQKMIRTLIKILILSQLVLLANGLHIPDVEHRLNYGVYFERIDSIQENSMTWNYDFIIPKLSIELRDPIHNIPNLQLNCSLVGL